MHVRSGIHSLDHVKQKTGIFMTLTCSVLAETNENYSGGPLLDLSFLQVFFIVSEIRVTLSSGSFWSLWEQHEIIDGDNFG